MRRNYLGVPAMLLGVVLSGCTFGPKYQRPSVATPATHRADPGAAPAPQTAPLAETKWETLFPDEELKQLIRTALAANPDALIAAARIVQAQAQVGITRADQLPSLNATGQAGRQRSPSNPFFPGFETNTSQLGFSAAWQLDFWGRYRKATEAARANLVASEWGQRAIASALVANVASAYYLLRELDREIEIARQTLGARQESLKLTQTLEQGGSISLIDVHQAEILVEQAARTIPDLERRIEQQENLIQVLLGDNPGPVKRGLRLTEQAMLPSVPAGLPSSLLERRPDIRQAESRLVAANAQIGVAKAAWFPQISLTGTGGYQSFSLNGLFDSRVFNVGANLTQPIFDAGRIRNTIRLTEAQRDELVIAYRQSIQRAFREAADSLIAYQKNREYRERQQSLAAAADNAAKLSDVRYRGGASSYLEVLTSQTALFDAQIQLSQAQLNERLSIVQIYAALGGGWEQ